MVTPEARARLEALKYDTERQRAADAAYGGGELTGLSTISPEEARGIGLREKYRSQYDQNRGVDPMQAMIGGILSGNGGAAVSDAAPASVSPPTAPDGRAWSELSDEELQLFTRNR